MADSLGSPALREPDWSPGNLRHVGKAFVRGTLLSWVVAVRLSDNWSSQGGRTDIEQLLGEEQTC